MGFSAIPCIFSGCGMENSLFRDWCRPSFRMNSRQMAFSATAFGRSLRPKRGGARSGAEHDPKSRNGR